MRTIKFNPESINNEEFSGWVEVEVPHYVDKMKSLRELKFKFDDKGEMVQNDDKLETLELMGKLAEKVIIKAEVKRLADGQVFGKDDLFYEAEFQQVIAEVATAYMSGFKPSKK